MDWRDLRIALAVGQHESLGRAAKSLSLDPTTVSRRITALETTLGVALFVRTRTRWRATEAGVSVLARCERMAVEVRGLGHDADRASGRVAGKVRVTSVDAVMTTWLVPHLGALRATHPDLRIELLITNDLVDLKRGRADVAIRLLKPRRAGLVVKRLNTVRLVVAGRPQLAALPPERRPVVLLGLMSTDSAENRAVRRNGGPPVGSATSFTVLMALIRDGFGIGLLPREMAHAEGFTVLDDDVPPTALWRATPEELIDAPRVRAVTDWLDAIFDDR